jgi:hypothetical protein
MTAVIIVVIRPDNHCQYDYVPVIKAACHRSEPLGQGMQQQAGFGRWCKGVTPQVTSMLLC